MPMAEKSSSDGSQCSHSRIHNNCLSSRHCCWGIADFCVGTTFDDVIDLIVAETRTAENEKL